MTLLDRRVLAWGLTGPIFGAIADKYGGHKAISLAFIFFIAGIYFLYAGPNTGIFFQIDLGILVGIGLGGTAISIPMSIVGKHFPLSNRTIAMSLVTAAFSIVIGTVSVEVACGGACRVCPQ